MARDKTPTVLKTCILCRTKVNAGQLQKIKTKTAERKDIENTKVHLKVLCAESFCMLFGLPANHPFLTVFINDEGRSNSQMCIKCSESMYDIHHTFWQLQNLELKLKQLQSSIYGRLRGNYESVPVSTIFAIMGEEDIENNCEKLKYDEIVKILFERIKDSKENWPKSVHTPRWKQASEKAGKISSRFSQSQSQSFKTPEKILPIVDEAEDEASCNEYILPSFCDDYPNQQSPTESDQGVTDVYNDDSNDASDGTGNGMDASDNFSDGSVQIEVDDKVDKPSRKHTRSTRSRAGSIKRVCKKVTNATNRSTRYLCVEDPDICSKTYSAKKHLRTHIRTFHRQRTFVCDYDGCTARFVSEEKLQKHRDRVHERKRGTEVCETCGLEVPKGELKKHFYMRHLGVGQYPCDKCSMDFNDEDELKMHYKLHNDAEYPFLCVICQNLFTNSLDLKAHVSSNHLSSGLKCNVCGIMKHNDFMLQRHMKIHDRAKRYTCECGKSFASKGYLMYHQEHFHTNAGKQFPCEVCGKTFLHMKNVLRHMITHSEDKPFKCKICLKTFNYSHLLKKHEEIHSGTKNYGCEICGKRFRQDQNLRQHMRSHRPKPEKSTTNKKQSTNATKDEVLEQIPVILDVKGDVGEMINCNDEGDGDPPSMHGLTPIAEVDVKIQEDSEVGGHTVEFDTVQEIEITNNQSQPHHTTTVVFVTADPNISWLQ